MRPTDLVARLGGDEFAIVQADAPQPGANQVRVNANVGVALSPEHGVATNDRLKESDLVPHLAKANGHGNCVLSMPERERQSQQHHALEVDLCGAAGRADVDSHGWRASR